MSQRINRIHMAGMVSFPGRPHPPPFSQTHAKSASACRFNTQIQIPFFFPLVSGVRFVLFH